MTTYIEEVQGKRKVTFVAVEDGQMPPNPWPPLPPLPPSGSTSDGSMIDPFNPDGSLNLDGQTPQYILTAQLTYITNHPGDPAALMLFARTMSAFVSSGLINQSALNAWAVNSTDNGNQSTIISVLKNAIDIGGVDYAFLYGYSANGTSPDPATAGTWAAVTNFITPLNQTLTAIQTSLGGPGNNAYIDGMVDETNWILGNTPPPSGQQTFEQTFLYGIPNKGPGHIVWGNLIGQTDAWGNVMQAGDVIWTDSFGFTFDWTQAEKTKNSSELQTINQMVSGLDPLTGNQFTTINNLDAIITKIQGNDFWQTFLQAMQMTGGNVGFAILLAMNEMTNNSLGQLSGNADVMDKQHGASQQALAIENFFRALGSESLTDATALRGNVASLFAEIDSSSQFTGLVQTLESAKSTLSDTEITYQYPKGAQPVTSNVWSLLTDPSVSSDELLAALEQGLTPAPTNPPDPNTPPANPTTALQGVIGAFDSIVTAITSASTQANTAASQIQSTIQAEAKVMTGVIDPNNGMTTGVINVAVKNQTVGS